VLIDAQPGFAAAIGESAGAVVPDLAPVFLRVEKLLVMADCLALPTIATFERPERNVWLPEPCERAWPAHGLRIEKQTYDCCGEPDVATAIAQTGRRQLLVAGAETDVCVLQSVLSLLESGYRVFLLEDCLFTSEPHAGPAVRRMEAAGAVPCTLKTAFYELMRSVTVYDDPPALGPQWERLLPLFGEPESFPAWSPQV
jgi:nicotinamidase-related amidase